MTLYPLGRREEFDERSRGFAAVSLLTTDPNDVRTKSWYLNQYLDQGVEGACVGFSIAHELAAHPFPVRNVTPELAQQIYKRAQKLDQWPGENYEGTSVIAGLKAAREINGKDGKPLIGSFRWAFGVKQVVQTLSWLGPVILGVKWFEGMFEPDATGFLNPTGQVTGGHAIMAQGVELRPVRYKPPRDWSEVDLDKSYVNLHNSWGREWGRKGRARIRLSDLDSLLKMQGEAAIPLERSV
jgi:hypothetical protein